MSLNWDDVQACPWNVTSLTILFNNNKIFQIVCEKINFGSKIRVPPQAKWKISHSSPKPISPQAFLKVSSPPGKTYSKILISPQNFGEKWHYEISRLEKTCLRVLGGFFGYSLRYQIYINYQNKISHSFGFPMSLGYSEILCKWFSRSLPLLGYYSLFWSFSTRF